MLAAQKAAWETAGHTASDPGLRDAYPDLLRAPIRLIVCPLAKDVNQGGLLRLAEAFRIEQVDFTQELDSAIDLSGERGTGGFQPWRWMPADDAADQARDEGYQVVALSLSSRAIPFDQMAWRFPLALVVGSELTGLPPEIEAKAEATVGIPLYGMVQSLNVATATGIVLQHAVSAYARARPEFTPARRASRELLGLPPVDYSSKSSKVRIDD